MGLLMGKKMREDKVREKYQSPVDAPMQNIEYSNTFHQVNKGKD